MRHKYENNTVNVLQLLFHTESITLIKFTSLNKILRILLRFIEN